MRGHQTAGALARGSLLLCAALGAALGACAPPTRPADAPRPAAPRDEAADREDALVGAATDRALLTGGAGEYRDAKLAAYLQDVLARTAAQAERAPRSWTLRILDSSHIAARSAPGGYVYLTRGLLACLGSEAELAATLAHEVAHVVRRHYLTQLAVLEQHGIHDGDTSRLPPVGRRELASAFRDNEREADELALGYLAKAGYAPQALAKVVGLFAEIERLAGGNPVPEPLRTHPGTATRLERLARATGAGAWQPDAYLTKLDGLPFGEDPRHGYLFGERYLSPLADLELPLPPPWRARLVGRDLIAVAPGGTVAFFARSEHGDPAATRQALEGEAAAAAFREAELGGHRVLRRRVPQDQGLIAEQVIVGTATEAWVLAVIRPEDAAATALADALLAGARTISEPALREIRVLRIRAVRLERETTLRALQASQPSRTSLPTLALINGHPADTKLPAGTWVKRIDE